MAVGICDPSATYHTSIVMEIKLLVYVESFILFHESLCMLLCISVQATVSCKHVSGHVGTH